MYYSWVWEQGGFVLKGTLKYGVWKHLSGGLTDYAGERLHVRSVVLFSRLHGN